MASKEAICRILINLPASQEEQVQSSLHTAVISAQHGHDNDDDDILTLEKEPLLPPDDSSNIPLEIRLKWVKLISDLVLNRQTLDDSFGIRDWDLILNLDGSVTNRADDASPPSPSTRVYPALYRIPDQIIEGLSSNQEKVQRAELFALGSLLYQVLSGKEVPGDLGNGEKAEHIQFCFAKGEFPEDIWELPRAVRILGCWCPGFAKDLLATHRKDGMFRDLYFSPFLWWIFLDIEYLLSPFFFLLFFVLTRKLLAFLHSTNL